MGKDGHLIGENHKCQRKVPAKDYRQDAKSAKYAKEEAQPFEAKNKSINF